MNYELKDKINVTTDLLSDLEQKCWQEIEHLQAQIANLADGHINDRLKQLFKNLLTSYYVFTGGIETLISEPVSKVELPVEEPVVPQTIETELIVSEPEVPDDLTIEDTTDTEVHDPFEYFVDFDDPIGEPLTDEDLYNN